MLIMKASFILFITTVLSSMKRIVSSNVLPASPVPASHWNPIISGVFPVHRCRIGLENSSLFYASLKSVHLRVISVRCVPAGSYTGPRTARNGVPLVSTGIVYSQALWPQCLIWHPVTEDSIMFRFSTRRSSTRVSTTCALSILLLMKSVTERNSTELRKEALGKLRLITDRIMLRRVKRDHTAAMELPPKRLVFRLFQCIPSVFVNSCM